MTLWYTSGIMELSVGLGMSRITKVAKFTPNTLPSAIEKCSRGFRVNIYTAQVMLTFSFAAGLTFKNTYFILIKYGS